VNALLASYNYANMEHLFYHRNCLGVVVVITPDSQALN